MIPNDLCPVCNKTAHDGECPTGPSSSDDWELTIHLRNSSEVITSLHRDRESAEGIAARIMRGEPVCIQARARTPILVRRTIYVASQAVSACVVSESPATEHALELGRKMGL